ncbi:hypothetical protein F5878DRAFT_665230 [Lentinula raphanica]|uniref:Uncharacterized protein n=1 Tax=Lentinula raphanica TaxID=153919 RepID=A0AA38U928_9AGAR|nr:hypothetical protein F5878DRAFT_665230 [Lentinula raphanica]
MLLLSMLVAAMAPVPTRPSSAAKMELSTSKFRAHKAPPVPPVDYKTQIKYNIVVTRQKWTSQYSRSTRGAYLSPKKAEDSYSPTEIWTVGLQMDNGKPSPWWGYRTERTNSPPFKWTPVKHKDRGLVGTLVSKYGKTIVIGTATMSSPVKCVIASTVNKKLTKYHSTELPSVIYNNHTLTFFWEELSRNPRVTGLHFTLDTWVNIFFTDMVKVEGSGAGFAVTEPWERELYTQIQNGELDIDDMIRLVSELSVGNSAEPVWEKVVEKRREELLAGRTPVEHKIGVTRQTKVDGPIDTYKQTETVIESNEVWTVGLRPVAVHDSAEAKDMVLYGYRSQRDSASHWRAVTAQDSLAGASYLAQAETMDLGTANMSTLTEKAVLMAVDQAIEKNHYDELPNLFFQDHVVMLFWEELNSRSKMNPPQVTNLSFDLSKWKGYRNMMLFQMGSAAGFEITRDMKEWKMYINDETMNSQ